MLILAGYLFQVVSSTTQVKEHTQIPVLSQEFAGSSKEPTTLLVGTDTKAMGVVEGACPEAGVGCGIGAIRTVGNIGGPRLPKSWGSIARVLNE